MSMHNSTEWCDLILDVNKNATHTVNGSLYGDYTEQRDWREQRRTQGGIT